MTNIDQSTQERPVSPAISIRYFDLKSDLSYVELKPHDDSRSILSDILISYRRVELRIREHTLSYLIGRHGSPYLQAA